jgi:hypothetical protein
MFIKNGLKNYKKLFLFITLNFLKKNVPFLYIFLRDTNAVIHALQIVTYNYKKMFEIPSLIFLEYKKLFQNFFFTQLTRNVCFEKLLLWLVNNCENSY